MKTDTKAYIKFELMGYPHGKTLICLMWFKGEILIPEIEKYLEDRIDLNVIYEEIYNIKTYKVTSISHINKNDDIGYKLLSIDKEFDHKPKNKNKIDTKKTKIDLRKIELEKYSTDDIQYMNDYSDNILFMREHDLNFDEFDFYIENQDLIEPEDTKKLFIECDGDIYKLKKNNIRNLISQ